MGVTRDNRPGFTPNTFDKVITLTNPSTSSQLEGYGTSIIVSGSTAGGNVFVLKKPLMKGATKTIIVDVNTTDNVDVITHSTAKTLFGTTHATIRFSTGAASGVHPKRCRLIAATSDQWALLDLSTGVSTVA